MSAKTIPFVFISLILFSFTIAQLDYRDVVDGELKMLIPVDFIHVPKEKYIPPYEGAPAPDDYYCNKDTTIVISFMKLPRRTADLMSFKNFYQMAFLNRASKVYKNDTMTINGNLFYVAQFDGITEGKEKFNTFFSTNSRTSTITGAIECRIAKKSEWENTCEKILESVQVK